MSALDKLETYAAKVHKINKGSDWWKKATLEEQKDYLKDHPGSKKKLSAQPVVKKSTKVKDLKELPKLFDDQPSSMPAIGTKVEGWIHDEWYPGVIQHRIGDAAEVKFDNGEVKLLEKENVRRIREPTKNWLTLLQPWEREKYAEKFPDKKTVIDRLGKTPHFERPGIIKKTIEPDIELKKFKSEDRVIYNLDGEEYFGTVIKRFRDGNIKVKFDEDIPGVKFKTEKRVITDELILPPGDLDYMPSDFKKGDSVRCFYKSEDEEETGWYLATIVSKYKSGNFKVRYEDGVEVTVTKDMVTPLKQKHIAMLEEEKKKVEKQPVVKKEPIVKVEQVSPKEKAKHTKEIKKLVEELNKDEIERKNAIKEQFREQQKAAPKISEEERKALEEKDRLAAEKAKKVAKKLGETKKVMPQKAQEKEKVELQKEKNMEKWKKLAQEMKEGKYKPRYRPRKSINTMKASLRIFKYIAAKIGD